MDRISVVCALVAALLFANTWQGEFVYDDSRAIVSNEDLRPTSSLLDLWRHDFWGTPLDHAGSHQSWRPLCVLSFRLNYSWSGLNPSSYHAVNIVLHSLVTLCLTLLMKPLIRRPWVRWMTGLAFAAHPIHCEAVASVVGRAELGAALHTLVALLAYRAHLRARRRYRPDKINDHERQDPRFKEIKEYDNDDDDKEEEEEQDREDKEWDKKRKRPAGRQEDEEKEKSLTESNRACRNPFERRQSLLSLFIHRVTICCCCPDLKKSQYRLDSSSSSSPSSSSPFSCNHGQHHQPRPNRQRHQQQPSRRYHQHVERHVDDGRDFRDRCQSGAYLAASLAAAGTAILWKETGMAAIPLCAIMELVQSHQQQHHRRNGRSKPGNRQSTVTDGAHHQGRNGISSKSLALLGFVLAGQLGIRWYVLGGGGWSGTAPWFAAADNPVSRDASLLTRTLTFFHLPAFNTALLLWPARLSFDWSMDAVPPIRRLNDARNLATILFYSGLAALLIKSIKRRTVLMSTALSLLILPFLPASNLFFYVGFVVAERVLYIPSMGYCLLVAAGLDRLADKVSKTGRRQILIQTAFQAWFGITLLLWSIRTVQRNADWSNEKQLYRSGIAINPAKAYGNLAAILAREQRQAEAEHAYRQALTHRPNMAETHFNLALLLQSQGRHQEASASYLQSIQYRPNLAAAYLNLGLLLGKQGLYDQSVHWLKACSQLDGSGVRDPQAHRHSQIQALISWGQLELSRGQPLTAVQLYKQALRRSPTSVQQLQAVYHSLGEAYQSSGDFGESERWFRTAVEQVQQQAVETKKQPHYKRQHKRTTSGGQPTRSDQVAAHLTYARFLAKNASRHDEAEQLFRQAQLMAPSDPTVYMFTGQFLLEASRPREAAESFVRAAHLAPADFEAVFNAATTLREVKELDRAELFYRQAVQLRPQDVTVYRNLGALLHVKGQWREAEDNYQLALRLVPDDRITLTNLKRLHQLLASKVAGQTTKNNNSNSVLTES